MPRAKDAHHSNRILLCVRHVFFLFIWEIVVVKFDTWNMWGWFSLGHWLTWTPFGHIWRAICDGCAWWVQMCVVVRWIANEREWGFLLVGWLRFIRNKSCLRRLTRFFAFVLRFVGRQNEFCDCNAVVGIMRESMRPIWRARDLFRRARFDSQTHTHARTHIWAHMSHKPRRSETTLWINAKNVCGLFVRSFLNRSILCVPLFIANRIDAESRRRRASQLCRAQCDRRPTPLPPFPWSLSIVDVLRPECTPWIACTMVAWSPGRSPCIMHRNPIQSNEPYLLAQSNLARISSSHYPLHVIGWMPCQIGGRFWQNIKSQAVNIDSPRKQEKISNYKSIWQPNNNII